MKMSIFDVSKISAIVAVILGSSWIVVEKGIDDGLTFLLFASLFVIIIIFLEQEWIKYKYHNL